MSKDEFLRGLEEALAGEVPAAVIRDNVKYYGSYISQEMAKGRTVDEIVAEIGEPRIVAKTIVEHAEAEGETIGTDGGAGYREASYGGTGGSSESYDQSDSRNSGSGIHYIDLSKWYWKLLLIVIGVLFVTTVFRIVGGILAIVGGIFSLVLRFAAPVLVVLLLVWFMKNLKR